MLRATNQIEVLLVEDNPTEVYLTRSAFDEAKISTRLSVVADGEEAMRFLRKQGDYADAPSPDLVLLDLNLPKKDGWEVLAEVKGDPVLRRIPVIVLTTSQHASDIENAYSLHANSYIRKPLDFDQFSHVIREIDRYWFATVTLPNR